MHDTWIRSSSRGDRLAEQTRPDNAKAAPRAWNEPRDVATSVCVMNVVICVDAPAAAVCDGLALACSCSCSKRERMRSLLKSRNRPFRKSTGTSFRRPKKAHRNTYVSCKSTHFRNMHRSARGVFLFEVLINGLHGSCSAERGAHARSLLRQTRNEFISPRLMHTVGMSFSLRQIARSSRKPLNPADP